MPTRKSGDLLSLLIERYGPSALALLAAIVIGFYRGDIAGHVSDNSLHMSNIYAAVLSWASIQIGFAFGVYGFVVGKTQGFVEAARDTLAMSRFLRYVKRANIGGFILTAGSLPLVALSPSPNRTDSMLFWVIAAWFCLFVWTFFALLRVAYNFGHLSSVRDQPQFHGA